MPEREDMAHSSEVIGDVVLTVRKDTAASTADTDGDNACMTTDANGRLHVIEPSAAAAAADAAEANLFTSAGKTVVGDLEFLVLNNAQGTTAIHTNTATSRFALMGLQGVTNTTGSTVTIQESGGGTVRVGPIATIVNTTIPGFSVTGFPYTISANDKGLEIVVSGSARIDGCLQFLEIANTA